MTQLAMKTNYGEMTIELFDAEAPETVKNFLAYVDAGYFDGTIFHRVIPGFMIQGGGFTAEFVQKETNDAIANEATNQLSNKRGTLAMARTNFPHSATSQFFINLVDNDFLDHKAPTPQHFGYCVFGRVAAGMEVADAIAGVATGSKKGHDDVPRENVVIESVKRI